MLITSRFCLCLSLPPERQDTKSTVVAIYTSFFLISVAPIVIEALSPTPVDPSGPDDRRWFAALFAGAHTIFVNPVVTALSFASLFAQARQAFSSSRYSDHVLSYMGLAVQAVIFTVLAVYWAFRLTLPAGFWKMVTLRSLVSWYQLVGWAAVDNAVFAVVQAILLLMGTMARRAGTRDVAARRHETSPLLS